MKSDMFFYVKEGIFDIISELLSIPIIDIKVEDVLIQLGIDSLMSVELLIKIEEKFGLIFDESDLDPEMLSTVESLINLVMCYGEK